jgi:hypothetical protein
LTAVALLGLIPLVQAQEGEQKEEKPPAEAKPAPDEGARMLERFDLNKDGRVSWEEFQKVRSGFTFLDADGDGFLTRADTEKLKQRRAAKREEHRKERARDGRRGRHPRDGRRGPRGDRQRRRADCDCRCHRDGPRFRGGSGRDDPRGFRGRDRGPRNRGGWDRRGPGRGWDKDRPRRGPPPRDRGPY